MGKWKYHNIQADKIESARYKGHLPARPCFAEALGLLSDYTHLECFTHDQSGPETLAADDNTASEPLWQRLRNDIVEHRELLGGTPQTPAEILELAQRYVKWRLMEFMC